MLILADTTPKRQGPVGPNSQGGAQDPRKAPPALVPHRYSPTIRRYAPAIRPVYRAAVSHPSGGGVPPITVAPARRGYPWGPAFILARGRVIAVVRHPRMVVAQVAFYRLRPEVAEFLAEQGVPYREHGWRA